MSETVSWDELWQAIKSLIQVHSHITCFELLSVVSEAEKYLEELNSLLAELADGGILLAGAAEA